MSFCETGPPIAQKGLSIATQRTPVSWVVLLLRYVLLALVLGFATYYLVTQWADVSSALALVAWPSLVLSFLLVVVGLGFGVASWVAILNGLGEKVPVVRAAQVLLVGQLGKYVPGSVWSYVMQMELGRQYGIARPRVLITALYAAGVGVVASLILGSLALPLLVEDNSAFLWLFALLPVGLICLHPRVMTWMASLILRLFRRPPLDHRISFSVVGRSLGAALASYICYGLHLFLLVNSLVDPDLGVLILLTGAMALGFTAGLIAFLLPSGIGAREGVLIAAMVMLLTVPQAAALTAVSRLMFTVADVASAGVAVLAATILRRQLAAEGGPHDYDEDASAELPGLRTPPARSSEAQRAED
ncbi:lysylphosphatidylglycerol synthase domain-containing protein [Microbacterium sp. NPDC058021]|uniref:lysylphosphatidylglycerol synthase domain-containing protein n=1 Tax=Microbacterium sp. NPDC058021 TaxID=3346306 RepID=UPI0036D94A67